MARHRLVIVLGILIAVATGDVTAVIATRPGRSTHAGAPRRAESVVAGEHDAGALDSAAKALDLIRPSPPKLAGDFTLKTADGRTVRLSEQRGKVVFINFWATWCPPCREEMPAMERLFQRTKNDGLVMLAVSVDGDPKAVTPFLAEQRFTFTVGLDPQMELANAYGVRALPASFIVDRQGHLAALALGPREWDNTASERLIKGLSRP